MEEAEEEPGDVEEEARLARAQELLDGMSLNEKIYQLMFRSRETGAGVLLISHNMADVFRVADRITVLRLGKTVAQVRKDEVTSTQIVGLITGAIEHL